MTTSRISSTWSALSRTHSSSARSSLPHVGRRLAGEKVLARRREDVDDLGVLGEPRLVLDAARDHAEVTRPARALLVAETELHLPLGHPEELLVRVLMGGGMDARLHRPPHDHLFVADEGPSRDLVRDFLFGQVFQRVIALHAWHPTASSRWGARRLIGDRPVVKRMLGSGLD